MATYSESAREHLRYLMMKDALAQIKNNKRAVRNIRAKLIADGLHPLDREEAENVVSVFFERETDSWIRAVGWLHGQGYIASQHYYKKELPQLIEAEEAAAEAEESGGIDVDSIIAAELGSDPDLSI